MLQRKMTRVIEGKKIDINDVSSSQSSFMNDIEDIPSDQDGNEALRSNPVGETKKESSS